jgi:hypothetical protein
MFSEQDVDRELKSALTVDPSPDFEARVLRRVGSDRPSPRPAYFAWLAAAASVIIAAGMFSVVRRTPAVVEPQPTPQTAVNPAPALSRLPMAAPPKPTLRPQPQRTETIRASRSAPRSTEPEVIVPADRLDAVRRLVRAVNEGRLEPPTEPLQEPSLSPAPVNVSPLVVEPIPLLPIVPAAEPSPPVVRGFK